MVAYLLCEWKTKHTSARGPCGADSAIHYLVISCLGIESGERSYTVIILPDSINFVFQ